MFRIKKYVLFIILNVILIVMLVGCKFNKSRVTSLCDFIEDCNNEEAKLIAEKIDDYDQYASNFVTGSSILTQGGVDARTPLYSACKSNNLEMMHYLLEHGADPNFGEKSGIYPLEIYCELGNSTEENGVELLLSYGADPDLYVSVPPVFHLVGNLIDLHRDDKYQKTDYVKEEKQEEYDMICQELINLIDSGANLCQASIDYEDRVYDCVLHDLAYIGESELLVMILEDYGGIEFINLQRENGDTPLIVAAKEGYSETCKILLERGADADIANDEGQCATDIIK